MVWYRFHSIPSCCFSFHPIPIRPQSSHSILASEIFWSIQTLIERNDELFQSEALFKEMCFICRCLLPHIGPLNHNCIISGTHDLCEAAKQAMWCALFVTPFCKFINVGHKKSHPVVEWVRRPRCMKTTGLQKLSSWPTRCLDWLPVQKHKFVIRKRSIHEVRQVLLETG